MNEKSQRYFIEIAYDGTRYHGWQIQENAVTVQQKLNGVLRTLLKRDIETIGCGRTDTGVHARCLYAHFDSPAGEIDDLNRILHSINALLPPDIAAKSLFPVASDVHARFDAISRSYEYHVHAGKDPFLSGYSWQLRELPDMERMNEAAAVLLEYEDFSCFSKAHTQVFTNNCLVSRAKWEPLGEQRMVFYISANRFLRNMVRAIVGTLMDIGNGKYLPSHMRTVIESKNRGVAGASVPACGLYLSEVEYPKEKVHIG
ncbi:tRNA pseudouridine(38-40) synthase TruA [Olivibacter sitiensis]|uniref:tRNA pseudouridine(38-40) synthase TruA n=1 Tax=Olivibacter sitiensis TaxID=376470 RepID=UPI000414715E|nr:tRNA pseudouridine(38-40) synthase TruA [Olivibacter sitiensis]